MFRRMRYQYKLFLSFAAIVLAALLVSATYFLRYNTVLIKNSIEQSRSELVSVLGERVDSTLASMDSVLKNIHAAGGVLKIIKSIPEYKANWFDTHPREYSDVKDAIYSALNYGTLRGSVSVISRYYDFVSVNSYVRRKNISKSDLEADVRLQEAMQTPEFRVSFPPGESLWAYDGQQVLTVMRPLRDTYSIYGVIEYSMNMEAVQAFSMLSEITGPYSYLLADGSGNIIYSKPGGMAVEPGIYNPGERALTSGVYYVEGANPLSVAYYKLGFNDWSVLLVDDMKEFTTRTNTLFQMVLITYLGMLGVFLFFLYFSSRMLSRPIRALSSRISNLSVDEDILLGTDDSVNEVSALSGAIDNFIHKIRQQNAALVASKERETQAYFDAMEAQLNPHFLYNTLNVIGVYGKSNGNGEVARMCSELARLLRYAIDRHGQEVTLADELENIRSYLFIMQMRYRELLEVSWDICGETRAVKVPKLILQPIVENCFKHGFKEASPKWRVNIGAAVNGGEWRVTIANNGEPFKDEALTRLYERFEDFKEMVNGRTVDKEQAAESVGMTNTLLRLYIYYHGHEYFSIKSENNMCVIELGGPTLAQEN